MGHGVMQACRKPPISPPHSRPCARSRVGSTPAPTTSSSRTRGRSRRSGGVIDGLRLGVAAQLEARSRKTLGEESLAFRHGARDGVELVEELTGVSHTTARMRVGLGSALAPAVSLTGELLPGRYPVLADAVAAGEVGIEAARVIVNTVVSIRRRADPGLLESMVEALTDTARQTSVEVVRDVADHWALALDPDGAEPKETRPAAQAGTQDRADPFRWHHDGVARGDAGAPGPAEGAPAVPPPQHPDAAHRPRRGRHERLDRSGVAGGDRTRRWRAAGEDAAGLRHRLRRHHHRDPDRAGQRRRHPRDRRDDHPPPSSRRAAGRAGPQGC